MRRSTHDALNLFAVASVGVAVFTLLLVTVLQQVVAGVGGVPMFQQPDFAPEAGAIVARFGDFDGDLIPDLATTVFGGDADVSTGAVTIRLNDGSGNFGTYSAVTTDIDVEEIALDDVNNDTFLDILGAGSGEATVWLGAGDGTFAEALPEFSVSFNSPGKLRFADFNDDGDPDFVADSDVYLGNGDGTFTDTPEIDFSPGSASRCIPMQLNDDVDDFEDLVCATGSDFVTTVLGNGDGTFDSAALHVTTVQAVYSIAVGDLDEDGNQDVLIGSYESDDVTGIGVLHGNGDGTLDTEIVYAIPMRAIADLAVTDVDGDTDPDVIALPYLMPAVFILRNTGAGALVYDSAVHVENRPFFLEVGNIDGDTDPDLAIPTSDLYSGDEPEDTGVIILHGAAGTRFDAPQQLVMNGGAEEIQSVDMDNDTDLDLVVANRDGLGVSVSLNNGDGTFTEPILYSSAPFGFAFALAIEDYDGDTFKDVAYSSGGGFVSFSGIFFNDGAGGLTGHTHPFGGIESFFAAPGDFNEDTFQDVVFHVSDFPPPLVARVFFGDGTGAFPTSTDLTVDNYPCGLLVDDLNADANTDIAFTQCEDDEVNIYFGDGSGGFGPMVVYPTPETPEGLKLVDMDGDLVKDLVVVAATSIAILPGLGGGTFDTAVETPIPENITGQFHRLAVGDVDLDGEQDVLLAGHMEADRMMYFAGNGDFTFDGPESYWIGTGSADIALGQLDGVFGLDAAVTDGNFNAVVLRHDGTDSFPGLRLGTFVESGYRWFENDDSADVGAPLAAIDTPATLPYNGAAFRLRLLLRADDLEIQRDDQQYKLQISEKSGTCDGAGIGETYLDIPNEIGEKPDPEDVQIRYHDNENVGDTQEAGLLQNLTPNTQDPRHGLTPVYRQSYHDALGGLSCGKDCFFDPDMPADDFFNIREETVIPAETEAMWDFALVDFSAPVATYCVRAVREDGSPLDNYENIAEFTTSDATPPVLSEPYDQSAYRWFDAADSVTPGVPLAAQNTPVTLASAGAAFRLRMLIHADDGPVGSGDEEFFIIVAEKSGTCDAAGVGEAYDDLASGSVGIQYDDNPSVSDNDATFSTFDDPIHGFDTVWTQTYEEQGDGTFGIVNTVGDEEDGLWDFALVDADATPGTTFCFRAVTTDGGQFFETYDQVAEITTFGAAPPGGGGGGGGGFVERDAVTVFSPNGGERIPADSEQTLTWDTSGRIDFVNLSFSIDGGRSWLNIARGAINSGRFVWQVPDIDVPEVYFRVEATDLSEVFASDRSDQPFAIVGGRSEAVELIVRGLRAFINTTTGCRSFAAGSFLQNQVSGEAEMLSSVCPGDFITTPSFRTVWYVTREFLRRPFFNAISFLTHQPNFQAVRTVTDATLLTLDLGNLMTPKVGTVLVKFHDAAEVYVLFENPADPLKPIARWLETEQAANANFGPDWDDYVIDLPTTMFDLFEYRSPVTGPEEIDKTGLLRRQDLERVTNPFTFALFKRVGELIRDR